MHLGKVVKSNSHCDYVIQLDDALSAEVPPDETRFGFGSFVALKEEKSRRLTTITGHLDPKPNPRPWCIGVVYNTQLFNPNFNSSGPRLSSEPDLAFTPDQVQETRTLLGVMLLGTLQQEGDRWFGIQRIPRTVVPFNTTAALMTPEEVYSFHRDKVGQPQFRYYTHLLRGGGHFAAELIQHILDSLCDSPFTLAEVRALEVLRKELSWKSAMGTIR